MFRVYFGPALRNHTWPDSWDWTGCRGLNPGESCTRQSLSPLSSRSRLVFFQFSSCRNEPFFRSWICFTYFFLSFKFQELKPFFMKEVGSHFDDFVNNFIEKSTTLDNGGCPLTSFSAFQRENNHRAQLVLREGLGLYAEWGCTWIVHLKPLGPLCSPWTGHISHFFIFVDYIRYYPSFKDFAELCPWKPVTLLDASPSLSVLG